MENLAEVINTAVTSLSGRFHRLDYNYSKKYLIDSVQDSSILDCKLITDHKHFPVSRTVFIMNFDISSQVIRNQVVYYYSTLKSEECSCLIMSQVQSDQKTIAQCVRKTDGTKRYWGKENCFF